MPVNCPAPDLITSLRLLLDIFRIRIIFLNTLQYISKWATPYSYSF